MTDSELICLLLFFLIGSILMCAGMLAGVRDVLCNIDYDLSLRNMREYCEGNREIITTENDA